MRAETNDRAGSESSRDRASAVVRQGRFKVFAATAAACLLSLSGCATKPTDPQALADYKATNDPLEPTNRFFYRVNTTVDRYTLKPVAQAYVYVVPQPARNSVHRFLLNLGSPTLWANDVLEGKPRRAGDTFVRFIVNSTAGVGGLFDVAASLGYPAHDGDGGMTLAEWGLPNGPFLFLPVLGPSSPRDLTGFGMDIGLSPLNYVPRGYGLLTMNWVLYGIGVVDARAGVLNELDQINREALDPYATLRSLYRQHRAAQIDALRKDNRMTTPDWYTH